MQELENVLEEIENESERYRKAVGTEQLVSGLKMAEEIIRKHMNDGWIPVEKYGLPKDEGVYDLTIIDGLKKYVSVRWQFLEGTHLSGTQHYVDGMH